MPQEKSAAFTQIFAYEKKGNSAVIRRCFSRDTKVVIPEQIEGIPVTEIGAYAFSAHLDETALKQEIEQGTVKITTSVLEERGMLPEAVQGMQLEKLVIPRSVVRVGRYCFYNCDHLKSLSFGNALKDWGSGVFTGCHHIQEINLAVMGEENSMLKDILDEIREELCVNYILCAQTKQRDGAQEAGYQNDLGVQQSAALEGLYRNDLGLQQSDDPEAPYREKPAARLMFPEFYEEGVENTPARILETRVHGTGILYRNCFQGRKIDFHQYDNAFSSAQVQESKEFLLRLVLYRLMAPYQLSEPARERYLQFLTAHLEDYARFLAAGRDLEGIRWISGALKDGSVFFDALTEYAGRSQYAEALGFVMEQRRKQKLPVKKRQRFEL